MKRQKKLGGLLKELRLRAGLSERSMGISLQHNSAFVRSYEAGRANLTFYELEVIADMVGLTITELLAEYERFHS